MGDLDVYGGDPKVVATLHEIDRVQHLLQQTAMVLAAEVELADFLYLPFKRMALALEVQNYLRRIEELVTACRQAADGYYTTEALAMRELDSVLEPTAPELAVGVLASLQLIGFVGATTVTARLENFEKIRPATPVSIAGLAGRVLRTESKGQSLIRIDSFVKNGQPVHLVVLPGTQVGGLLPGTNPLDIGSNLRAMAGLNLAASETAVLTAMRQAGVARGDHVVFVGHSQGGLIAANIAAGQQQFKTVGLVSLGSPLAQLGKRLEMPVLSVEHRNDPVPKLALAANPNQPNWVTVQKNVDVSSEDRRSNLVQVHSLDNYLKTAQQADLDDNAGLVRVRNQILSEFDQAEPVKSSHYRLIQTAEK